ncbi:MAG: radical SAM protein [Clostridiales Family XIII bacterium]|jgi:nitrogen fixation protein NifB|nr:radical SAM protein [Clostridiales Family XIII bacterium]
MKIHEVKNLHPCFNRGSNKARMHLPVSPACNILCKFCNRQVGDGTEAIRPGVARDLVRPEDAPGYVENALALCPEISVVGIAGPGDTLATDHAFRAFSAIRGRFPNLIHCMSTNGLLLPEKINGVIDAGVSTLTVTINAVDPDILAKINGGIYYHGEYFDGAEGGLILIRNQLEGVKLAAEAGLIVKINTVLIPGINGNHIEAVARQAGKRGAAIFNIIPLIPQHLLSGEKEPNCGEIDLARSAAEKHIPVFRHCQHCRADAVGFLGGADFGSKIYQNRVEDTFSHG